MSYLKQVLNQTKKIQKQKFVIALVKQHLSSDIRTIKKHSITSNTNHIQNCKGNIGIYQQTKLRTYIYWEILGTHKLYNQSSKRCLPYLNEKLAIVLHKDNNMLNKRSEVISTCRHRNKYMLTKYDSKD